MMSGVMGIFMSCFGLVFTIVGFAEFPLMGLFGLVWTGFAIAMTVRSFQDATGKNRRSLYDIVDSDDEPDPLQEHLAPTADKPDTGDSRFCPWCGKAVGKAFTFCNGCGKKLP